MSLQNLLKIHGRSIWEGNVFGPLALIVRVGWEFGFVQALTFRL